MGIHHRRHSKKGFTLVETLLSLALFLLIMLLVTSTLNQFLQNMGRMGSVMSSYDGVRVFATQITNELGSAIVRDNQDRWLNLRVLEIESDDEKEGTQIFFTSPDDNIRSIRTLNFISHYVYFWDKEEHSLYRAVYNTQVDPEPLAKTASDASNRDQSANQRRLKEMTLAYRYSDPYGWTESPEMEELMEQEKHQAILDNVFDFKILCYEEPKSTGGEPETTWEDPRRLPKFIELELHVANANMVAGLRKEIEKSGELSEESKRKLRRFTITVPMRNYGIYDSRIY